MLLILSLNAAMMKRRRTKGARRKRKRGIRTSL
jgi:hypothetical protein